MRKTAGSYVLLAGFVAFRLTARLLRYVFVMKRRRVKLVCKAKVVDLNLIAIIGSNITESNMGEETCLTRLLMP